VDASDPERDDEDDEEKDDEAENKGHVALALTGEVAFAHGSRFGRQSVTDVVFHAPDGVVGGLVLGGRIAGLLQLFGQEPALLGEKAFLFRELPPPGFKRVGFVAVPRHAGMLSETAAKGNWSDASRRLWSRKAKGAGAFSFSPAPAT